MESCEQTLDLTINTAVLKLLNEMEIFMAG